MIVPSAHPDTANRVSNEEKRCRLISIVIPVFNESANVRGAYEAVCDVFAGQEKFDLEFVFTDNHSDDATFDRLSEIAALDARVKVLRFNRNYGFHRSLITGYRLAQGEAVVQLDCDLQDPPKLIPEFLELWERGHDVVVGIRKQRQEGYLLTLCRRSFYAFINYISDDQITRDAGDFRLIDRRVLDKVTALNDINPYIRGLSSAFATREVGVPYKRERRHYGRSKFPIGNLIKHASDGIFSMTLFPLRLAGQVSFIISIATIVLASYYFFAALFFGRNWPGGFATLVLLLLFGISLNAGFLAIIGKYVGSIYLQQQNRPIVIIERFINVDPQSAIKVEKV